MERSMTNPASRTEAPTPSTVYDRIQDTLKVRRVRSDTDLARLVEDRLSTAAVAALIAHGLTEGEVHALVIPRRTLSHRKRRRERLTREESDRAVRLARLLALAEDVFGEPDKALHWVRAPKRRFGGRTPLAMLATDAGARLVEEQLYQIDEGMLA